MDYCEIPSECPELTARIATMLSVLYAVISSALLRNVGVLLSLHAPFFLFSIGTGHFPLEQLLFGYPRHPSCTSLLAQQGDVSVTMHLLPCSPSRVDNGSQSRTPLALSPTIGNLLGLPIVPRDASNFANQSALQISFPKHSASLFGWPGQLPLAPVRKRTNAKIS